MTNPSQILNIQKKTAWPARAVVQDRLVEMGSEFLVYSMRLLFDYILAFNQLMGKTQVTGGLSLLVLLAGELMYSSNHSLKRRTNQNK